MRDNEQCKMCKDMPPCDKGKCCKRCNALNCNSRQCVNPQAIKRAQQDKLPWYLKDELKKERREA